MIMGQEAEERTVKTAEETKAQEAEQMAARAAIVKLEK
jgi:hypothetical protein